MTDTIQLVLGVVGNALSSVSNDPSVEELRLISTLETIDRLLTTDQVIAEYQARDDQWRETVEAYKDKVTELVALIPSPTNVTPIRQDDEDAPRG